MDWLEISEQIYEAERSTVLLLAMHLQDSAGLERKGDWEREAFIEREGLQPPPVFRLIDIHATCQQEKHEVVLLDYHAHRHYLQQVGYSAISHTYGMDVYHVFNCQCTTKLCSPGTKPRCLIGPCPHHVTVSEEASRRCDQIVTDILGMCKILQEAGVDYAWHDGVCIAQHDDEEVVATIKCMGWVYASAKETIIFLHYVGKPMAPIRPSDNDDDELTCRWHTRAWTLQEAALSKRRRYCIRLPIPNSSRDCQSLEEFEQELNLWYNDESSKVEIIEEDVFFGLVTKTYLKLAPLLVDFAQTQATMNVGITGNIAMWGKGEKWLRCLANLISTLILVCFNFPSATMAIVLTSGRQSKHLGDHINSILALTGVKEFVAPKDDNLELSIMEFFKRQKQPRGLATALFLTNALVLDENVERYMREIRKHTWVPLLWTSLNVPYKENQDWASTPIHLRVLDDGKLELTAELLCLKIKFVAKQSRLYINRGDEIERLFTTSPTEFLLEASRPYFKMYIAVLPHLSRFQTTAPESALCDLGIGNVSLYYSNHDQATSSSSVSNTLNRIDQLKDGETFNAHLVVPMHYYKLGIQETTSFRCSIPERRGTLCQIVPILIVQGNSLHVPVSKIGTFVPTYAFLSALADDDGNFVQSLSLTYLDKIIIF